MNYRRKEALVFIAATLSVGAIFSYIGIYGNQTTWKFDMAVIGAFLLGDYPLRWMLGLRESRLSNNSTVVAIIHLLQGFYLLPRSDRAPPWTRLAFASAWFLLAVLLAGEAAYLVAITAGVLAAQLNPCDIVIWSLLLSLVVATDFQDNYHNEQASDDFWENIPA